ncbi:MAG: FKBP-type peptidyl-prolyl cis-trans isomerase, partial [Thermoflexibacteraceae bacterium]
TPLDFNYNSGQMIKGFDEGVGFLKKGGKATLFIPSALGYGDRATGSIPPNSVLMFDIELVNVE